jgi:LmbE family N-acetylglucosaminyl deacetylase
VRLIVDDTHLGPPELAWNVSKGLASVQPIEIGDTRRIVLVAAHPDDEVFGAGGLIQYGLSKGMSLQLLAVTDGEGCHPDSEVAPTLDLAAIRHSESREALRRLGWVEPDIAQLHLPDGEVMNNQETLRAKLMTMLRPGDLCVASWWRDGHPDHDACGAAALWASQMVGAKMLGYLVWAWHWANPQGADIPWEQCRRLDLQDRERARKRWATGAFDSQINPIGRAAADAAVLPAPLLRRFWRPYEIYVEASRMPV